jgi:hypothetical protein
MTLSQPWRKLVLTVHVATSVGALGANMSLLALGAASVAGADPVTIYPAARLVGVRLIAPLAVIALVTGLALGLLTQWGLFRYWWVTIKLATVVVLKGAALFVLVPALDATAEAVTGATPQLGARERLPLLIAPAAASALLAVAVALAVFKPNWRLWPSGTDKADPSLRG